MKQKSIIFTLSSLIILFLGFMVIGISYGWFADVVDLNSGTLSVGDIEYTKSGSFITDSIIYPGEELINLPIELTNSSSIDSQMRVKITYTKVTRPVDVLVTETAIYSGSSEDHLDVTFGSAFTYSNDYWYYGNESTSILANSGLISLITSLYYDGFVVGNDYSGITCNINIIIEVKQNDNVTWSELTSYDFSTGYPS